MPLFDRQPRGLAFTPAGRAYHARIAAAFADMRRATDELRPAPDTVLVSVTPTFAAKWLIPNLPAFSAAHPDIELRVLATERVSSFHADGIDLAVRQGTPPSGAALRVVRLFRQEIIAVCAPRLVQDRPLPLNAETLAGLPRIHDSHDLWPEFLKFLSIPDHGGRGVRLNQTSLAIDAALSGQGVALVSRFLVTRDLAAGALVEISPRPMPGRQDFYLVAPRQSLRGRAADTAFRWFQSMGEAGSEG